MKCCTHENKLTTTTHGIDESRKYDVEWKKLVTKRIHIVWFHLYKVQKQANFIYGATSQDSGPFKKQEGVAVGKALR